jgi:hypothetical protein
LVHASSPGERMRRMPAVAARRDRTRSSVVRATDPRRKRPSRQQGLVSAAQRRSWSVARRTRGRAGVPHCSLSGRPASWCTRRGGLTGPAVRRGSPEEALRCDPQLLRIAIDEQILLFDPDGGMRVAPSRPPSVALSQRSAGAHGKGGGPERHGTGRPSLVRHFSHASARSTTHEQRRHARAHPRPNPGGAAGAQTPLSPRPAAARGPHPHRTSVVFAVHCRRPGR